MQDCVPIPGRRMNQVREVMRFSHHAYSIEISHIRWILQSIRYDPESGG